MFILDMAGFLDPFLKRGEVLTKVTIHVFVAIMGEPLCFK